MANKSDLCIKFLGITQRAFVNIIVFLSSNSVLTRAIENVELPLNSTDPDLLLLKAISAASTHCLFQCMNLLQRHHDVTGDTRSDMAAY